MRSLVSVTVVLFLAMLAQGAVAADVQALIDDCEQCHGKEGDSPYKDVPIIGGMSTFYLEEQMLAYQDKRRPCEEAEYPEGPQQGQKTDMCSEVENLSKDQITSIAEYFASKPFVPAKQDVDQALAKKGEAIHEAHCRKCHTEGGGLAFDDAGVLAGQWRGYLLDTMQDYREGKRWMPEKMEPKINELSEDEVKAVVEFYVSQEPVDGF